MNQDQQPRLWWRDNRLWGVLAGLILAGLVIIAIVGDLLHWASTETIWRLLDLLIIPAALLIGASLLSRHAREREEKLASQERKNDRQIAQDRAREEALQRYLDNMQGLILDKGLRISKNDAEIRGVARTRTLAALRSLDGTRKGQVVRFLYESNLIGKVVREESVERHIMDAIVGLPTADLRDADLREADLSGADLHGANLRRAKLSDTNLRMVNLSGANLREANLSFADLRGTNLKEADLLDADLGYADLRGAKGCTNQQLAYAASLVQAILPNETEEMRMSKEEWGEYKESYQ